MDTTDIPVIPLLRLAAMAARARVPARWLREEADAGRVPCLRAGREYLFDADAVFENLTARARVGGDNDGQACSSTSSTEARS